jgi:hypothetical protein
VWTKWQLPNIRKGKYRPDTIPAAAVCACMSRLGYPPWILKWGELESSGQRLISSIGKTKGKRHFFQQEKKIFTKCSDFLKKS